MAIKRYKNGAIRITGNEASEVVKMLQGLILSAAMKNQTEIESLKKEIKEKSSTIALLIDNGAFSSAYDEEKEVNDLQRRLEVLEDNAELHA